MVNRTDGKGCMGINQQPAYPTGVTMDRSYVAPNFCGSEGADKSNQTFFSCMQALDAPESCCCTGQHSLMKKCNSWTCCKNETKCKKGACV